MSSPPSSPPAIDFPDSDADVYMEENIGESVPGAPPHRGTPLFHPPPTPSVAGTPARPLGSDAYGSSPIRGLAARRAVGLSTPRKPPLFAGGCCSSNQSSGIQPYHQEMHHQVRHWPSLAPHQLEHLEDASNPILTALQTLTHWIFHRT